MFKKILIANRGEIACRIIGTCRRLGIESVAICSEVEADARHVTMADEAHCIGGPSPVDSYLSLEKILKVAKSRAVEAIHPGYGFLSENAVFAHQCQMQGVVFIGPSPQAIEAMGSKGHAKYLMEQANINVVPGYYGDAQEPEILLAEAEKIGYPLMIKAVNGGGGKGMRLVEKEEEFTSMLDSAKREARNAFGDDTVLLEHFIANPRHIEFQVFGDQHGNVVHLFERECSIQRRYQKIIEETPSPFLDGALRQKMGETAVTAAKAIDYTNAGTVEFIVGAERHYYFLEMNTRLQVEHPVTEMTTGLDLVEWQLRVAHGEALPFSQAEIPQRGHAIEVRVYAENPQNHFLPSTGCLTQWVHPPPNPHFRIDSGVGGGEMVQIYYDAMLAKLIVWDENRAKAIVRLRKILAQTGVLGVVTNLALLQSILQSPDFLHGTYDTLFIEKYRQTLVQPSKTIPAPAVWAAALYELLRRETLAAQSALRSGDPSSPWNYLDFWELNGQGYEDFEFRQGEGQSFSVRIHKHGDDYVINRTEHPLRIQVKRFESPLLTLQYEGRQETMMVLNDNTGYLVIRGEERYLFSHVDPLFVESDSSEQKGELRSPIPGLVRRVLVAEGDYVKGGQTLLILEAMKMEHRLLAPHEGVVGHIHYQEGKVVEENVIMITFKE